MASGKSTKHYYQPSLGVRTDFEKLLQRFSALGTVRYQKFSEIFRDMKMSLYCAGRQTQREAREYVEECFEIAIQFWLPPSSFLVRVGTLYLLYGLYFFQMVSPRVKIRVTPEQWKVVTEFHKDAKEQQHLDLEYIFQKMQVHKAFHFVATPRELYPTFKEREEHHVIPEHLTEEKSVVEEIFSEGAVNQLELVHEQYQKMKVALNGEDATKPDPSLDVIHSDFISGINKTLQTHRSRQRSTKYQKELADYDLPLEDTEEMEMDAPSTSNKKSLKKKAFSTSLGYYKERKKGQEQSSEDTADSADNYVMSPDRKPVRKDGRGRQAVVDLFEKDEIDSGPVQADLSEVFNMPDIESMIPAKFREPEDAPEAAGTSARKNYSGNRGKAFGLAKKRELIKKRLAAEAERSEGVKANTVASRGQKKKSTKESSEHEPCSPKKIIKKEPADDFSDIKTEAVNERTETSDQSKKLTRPKTTVGKEQSKAKKSGTSVVKVSTEGESSKKKVPSAQEVLFESLKQRRKRQRSAKK